MKNRIAILLVATFAVGLAFSACQSKNQCKQYHKKQKKRRRMSENIIQKNDFFVEFIKHDQA